MANEICLFHVPDVDLYMVVLRGAEIWNGSAFVTLNGANWDDYAIALTESEITGAAESMYTGSIPAGCKLGANALRVVVYIQGEGTSAPSSTDLRISEPYAFDVADGRLPIEHVAIASAGAFAGKISGAGTGTETLRSVDDQRNIAVATVTAAGNRTAVSLP